VTSAFDQISAPTAPRIQFVHDRVTGPAEDPWAWLNDRDHPETIPYLNAENDYADAWFAAHAPLIEQVFQEIRSRIVEDDTSVPTQHGPWWYVRQTLAGSGYTVHRRGATRETAGSTVILDENIESQPFESFRLGSLELSHDHNFLAWSHETDGSERFTIKVRDLRTNSDLADTLVDTSNANLAWSSDAKYLFYVTHDDAMRPDKVWRHTIGDVQNNDALIFAEPDERFNVNVSSTRSGQWIIIESQSRITSECFLLSANDPLNQLIAVRGREQGIEYRIDHWGDRFVVLTNLDAVDFRVMSAPLDNPGDWTEIVGHVVGQRINIIEPFCDHLVIQDWRDAQQRLRVLNRDGKMTSLRTGVDPHQIAINECPEWTANILRYSHESLVSSTTVFDHNVLTNQRVALKTQAVPNATLTDYITTREWAIAQDGTRVPLDIVRHKDTPVDGTAPGLLYGYGSYEYAIAPWFSVARLSLLDRGWIWALAHPRGGGEYGRNWYLNGKLLNKKHTFSDINDCARHLYQQHVAPGRLAVRGRSAGGLMVGACITSEPSLYGAAIAEVPFVDVVTSMSDPSLPLTINEWEEWGDPRSEPAASYMLSYSPYDNTHAVAYPPMLVTAGLNDPRVCYHEPAKWVAKLRSLKSSRQPLIFRCEMDAGHAGKSDRYDQWRDEAKVMAFLFSINI
jgi:oligopeptidase B